MARNQIAKKAVDGSVVSFNFSNGSTIAVDVTSLPEDIVRRLAIHGAMQKIGDSYAGAESVTEAIGAAQKVVDSLTAGNWGVERTAGESEGTLFAQVLARLLTEKKGNEVSVETAAAIAEEKGKDWQKAVRATSDFIRVAAEIKASKAKGLDELLA